VPTIPESAILTRRVVNNSHLQPGVPSAAMCTQPSTSNLQYKVNIRVDHHDPGRLLYRYQCAWCRSGQNREPWSTYRYHSVQI